MLTNYNRSALALAELLKREGVEDSTVLEAIASTPRHIFIDDVLQHKAYQNTDCQSVKDKRFRSHILSHA